MGYIRNTSSIIPGWDIKRNSADMKELYEIAPPYFWGRRPSWPAKESYGLKVLLNENMIK